LPTSKQIIEARERGERVRDEIARQLRRARGPTSSGAVNEALPNLDPRDVIFQLDRMADEGRAIRQSGGFVLAPGRWAP
jgi:hypothetical protein